MTSSDIGIPLLQAINSKDAQKSHDEIERFKEKMRDVTVGANYVLWITEPANLTLVHKALAEDLQVPPRLLAIKRVAMSRTQRAALLMQAIGQAIKRVHSL